MSVVGVEDLECIEKVEVWFQSCFDFGTLEFTLKEYVVFKNLSELSLLYSVEAALIADYSWRLLLCVRKFGGAAHRGPAPPWGLTSEGA